MDSQNASQNTSQKTSQKTKMKALVIAGFITGLLITGIANMSYASQQKSVLEFELPEFDRPASGCSSRVCSLI